MESGRLGAEHGGALFQENVIVCMHTVFGLRFSACVEAS